MRRRPKTVSILGVTYEVVYSKAPIYLNGEEVEALCSSQERQIILPDRTDQDRVHSDLLHEVLEAVNFELDLQLNHTQITSLERGLHGAGFRIR